MVVTADASAQYTMIRRHDIKHKAYMKLQRSHQPTGPTQVLCVFRRGNYHRIFEDLARALKLPLPIRSLVFLFLL